MNKFFISALILVTMTAASGCSKVKSLWDNVDKDQAQENLLDKAIPDNVQKAYDKAREVIPEKK